MKTLAVYILGFLFVPTNSLFRSITDSGIAPGSNPSQLNYGVAITDVDGQPGYEVVVAGYDGPNLVLKWNNSTKQLENIAINDPNSPYFALRDPAGQAIGVTACDVDGDGREEIYFLNTNAAYSGQASYPDKLFKFRDGKYTDIFSDEINQGVSSYSAGRSVACIDRLGRGKFGIYLANYASGQVGAHDILEMDEGRSDSSRGRVAIRSVGREAGVERWTGGRGVTVGPILSDRSDIFCDNERGANFLFKNRGDGTFQEVAESTNIPDRYENGRGVALSDFNNDGRLDILYGNWNGPHRIYIQDADLKNGNSKFRNIADNFPAFRKPTPIRTVIAADFDNNGEQEIFLNNIAYRGDAPNSVHTVRSNGYGVDPSVEEVEIGDALEPSGKGTGGAVTDLDGDGILELVLSHGESGRQPVTLYQVKTGYSNNWLRVEAKTPSGAPARGAKVTLTDDSGKIQTRVIDAGSGYLCQMEPVAHFGLGSSRPSKVEVLFTDGSKLSSNVNGVTNTVLKLVQSDVNAVRARSGRRLEAGCSFINRFADEERCIRWKSMGFCGVGSMYRAWMQSNCQAACKC